MARPEPLPETPSAAAPQRRASGILPAQAIRRLIADGALSADVPITDAQIQPASLDLRLGAIAYRVRASFLPGAGTVMDKVKALGKHSMPLADGAVLERGCVYIVPLLERVRLPKSLAGAANPKSSTGRLDVFTRLIADGSTEFDRVRGGHDGPLYAEISPRTFSVLVRTGDRLSQLRLRKGNPAPSDAVLRDLHERMPLVHGGDAGRANIDGGVGISIDLEGTGRDALLGYRAKHHADLIDLSKIGHYDPREFWEPIHAHGNSRTLILNPDDFYILASRERVSVPPDFAAELVPYDPLVGEFRVHYAGFFDPGFGYADGTKAVLEVRSHDVPFVLEHGQVVGRLVYERLTEQPEVLYGAAIGSHYSKQGLTLSKHFRPL